MDRISLLLLLMAAIACNTPIEPDGRDESTGYRSGTANDGYTSNGERGNIGITEVFGPVQCVNPTDVFVELQNKHPRPVYLKGWLLRLRQVMGMRD